MNFLRYQKGQSLIELLVAMAVFVLALSTISFLIIDSYVSNRAGRERTQATFLAEEGLEAAKSIRDNNWANLDDLSDGSYRIAVSGNNWIFQESEEDITGQLRDGKRKIIIDTIGPDRKKITSKVTWELTAGRPQEVNLVTYLTNWKKTEVVATCEGFCKEEGYNNGKCQKPEGCKTLNLGEVGECTAPKICCCE